MKKIAKWIVLLLVSILALNACAIREGGTIVLMDFDERSADKIMKQVVKALEKEDKKTLKNLFSKQALEEGEEFDKNLDNLFEIFQGELKPYDFDLGHVGQKMEYGKREREIKSHFNIDVGEESYSFFLVDYPINTLDPDNLGLYTLRVTNYEEDLSWQEKRVPGIYISIE